MCTQVFLAVYGQVAEQVAEMLLQEALSSSSAGNVAVRCSSTACLGHQQFIDPLSEHFTMRADL